MNDISARDAAYIRQGGRCMYCGRLVPHTKATCEHLIPRSRGGKRTRDNVGMACRACNMARGSGSWILFRVMIQVAMKYHESMNVV